LTKAETGSIADIVQRLLLWATRPEQPLAMVRYGSEFSRQQVTGQVESALVSQGSILSHITLQKENPVQQLLSDLARIQSGVVFVSGFSAWHLSTPDIENFLRQLNMHRETFAAFPLKQVWWMLPRMYEHSLLGMPDLISWFMPRLELTEHVASPQSATSAWQAIANDIKDFSPVTLSFDDAVQRADRLIERYERTKQNNSISIEGVQNYLLPAFKLLLDVYDLKRLNTLLQTYAPDVDKLKQQFDPDHSDTTVLNNLAELYFTLGHYGEAEPLFLQALAITQKQLGPEHPDTARILNNLSVLYLTTGRYTEAEPLLIQALAIKQKQLGPEHQDTASSLNNLATLYNSTGRYTEAEPLLLQALAITQKQLGPEHPDTANSLNNLAMLYLTTGRYTEAELLLIQALAIRQKQLGPEHPDTARSLNNLARLYDSTGRYTEAEPLFLQALAIWQKQLGPEHPDTARSLNNLAMHYLITDRYTEAEPLFSEALRIFEMALGTNHPDTVTVRKNHAACRQAMAS
jgi:tetratricopeptide (TPR) repeat protein